MSLQADIAALQDANTMLRSRIDEITAKAEVAQQQHQMMRVRMDNKIRYLIKTLNFHYTNKGT